MHDKTITNARGHKLYVSIYETPVENKGFIMFHHGYGSHTGIYHAVYQTWAAQGMTVIAHDSQGHGRSKGDDPKLHVSMDYFDHWVNDIYQVRKEVLEPMQPAGGRLPVFMGGQSMGGTLTVMTALRDQSAWQGIVLVSPGIDAERNLMLNLLEKLQSIALMICPNARIVPSPPFDKCTNLPQLVHQFKTDPLMDQGPMRVKTGRAFLDAFAHIANPTSGARMLTLPILMVASKTDQIVSVSAIQRFLKEVQSKDLTVHWVEGGFHELFLGPWHAESLTAVMDWLQTHV
ncbi:hypothetical protein WJX77_009275 [Trebouxia sp. C0004]